MKNVPSAVEQKYRLPRPIYNMLQAAIKYFHSEICVSNNSFIILAVSGGSDSLAMAVLMKWIAEMCNLKIVAFTINHCLRKEAEEDIYHVKKICAKIGIRCVTGKFSALKLARQKKIGIEEAGREGRYALFEYYRKLLKADFVSLGHQKHDLSEDVIMRLLRGCGWPALGGMLARDDQRHIIRPLLWADPADLKKMLASLSITWREDESNKDINFLRNRVRANLLPFLRRINPAFDNSVQNLHQFAKNDKNYWEQTIIDLQNSNNWQEYKLKDKSMIVFLKSFLESIHVSLRLRLYIYTAKKLNFHVHRENWQIQAAKLFSLDNAIIYRKSDKIFQLGNDIYAKVGKYHLIFYKLL